MRCPLCFHNDSVVLDTRHEKRTNSKRRRRVCVKCGRRYTTTESIDPPIKLDEHKECVNVIDRSVQERL